MKTSISRVMRIRFLPLIALLVFLNASSALATGRQPTVALMKIQPPGSTEFYHIAKIEIDGAVDGAGKQMANRLLKNANNFVVDEFERRYPNVDKSFFKQMREKGIQIEGQSSMVVIFRGNDPSDIVATLRFAMADADGSIPLEHDLSWKYPRRKFDRTWWSEYDVNQGKIRGIYEPGKRLTGDPLEIKNFVVAEGLTDDLVPMLYFFAEDSHLSDVGRSVPISEIPKDVLELWGPLRNPSDKKHKFRVIMNRTMAYEYKRKFGFTVTKQKSGSYQGGYLVEGMVEKWGDDPMKPPTMSVSPSEYVLECDEKMVPYYQRLGFELVQEEPVMGRNFVMRISRRNYLEFGLKVFQGRPGYKLWNESEQTAWISAKSFYANAKKMAIEACDQLLKKRR